MFSELFSEITATSEVVSIKTSGMALNCVVKVENIENKCSFLSKKVNITSSTLHLQTFIFKINNCLLEELNNI